MDSRGNQNQSSASASAPARKMTGHAKITGKRPTTSASPQRDAKRSKGGLLADILRQQSEESGESMLKEESSRTSNALSDDEQDLLASLGVVAVGAHKIESRVEEEVRMFNKPSWRQRIHSFSRI